MSTKRGFWLLYAALLVQALSVFTGFLGDIGIIVIAINVLFAVGAFLIARSHTLAPRSRAALIAAGIALLVGSIPLPLFGFMLSIASLAVLACVVIILGFEMTRHRGQRILIAVGAVGLAGFRALVLFGLDLFTTLALLAALLALTFFIALMAGAAYVGWSHGEEDLRRRAEGKPPKWEGFYDPNSPFGPKRRD